VWGEKRESFVQIEKKSTRTVTPIRPGTTKKKKGTKVTAERKNAETGKKSNPRRECKPPLGGGAHELNNIVDPALEVGRTMMEWTGKGGECRSVKKKKERYTNPEATCLKPGDSLCQQKKVVGGETSKKSLGSEKKK